LPSFSGNPRKLEFQKDDFGLSVWPARSEKGSSAEGRRAVTIAVCDSRLVHLAVHGRDAESYHVGGARWFFDRAQCEQQRAHVLPSLVDLINLESTPCAPNDAGLLARPPAHLKTGTYYVWQPDAKSCAPIEVAGPKQPRLQSGYVRVKAGLATAELSDFRFDEVGHGRYLWRSGGDSPDGDLLVSKPFEAGVQIGETRWYRDEPSCRQAHPSR
jgi:hypothetical protein